MQSILAHDESGCGPLRPRHPIVCLIDAAGIVITLFVLVSYQSKPPITVMLVALLPLYVISCTYHWLPQSNFWQKADHAMIAVLIAVTYIPYWGTQLPVSEMVWRFPILGILTTATILLRCTDNRWRNASSVLYPILGSYGCVLSFTESRDWLPPFGLALFWGSMSCYLLQFFIWRAELPKSNVFGYREVQHVVLLCGTTLQTFVVLQYL